MKSTNTLYLNILFDKQYKFKYNVGKIKISFSFVCLFFQIEAEMKALSLKDKTYPFLVFNYKCSQ